MTRVGHGRVQVLVCFRFLSSRLAGGCPGSGVGPLGSGTADGPGCGFGGCWFCCWFGFGAVGWGLVVLDGAHDLADEELELEELFFVVGRHMERFEVTRGQLVQRDGRVEAGLAQIVQV